MTSIQAVQLPSKSLLPIATVAGEGGTLPPVLVCGLAGLGADNDKHMLSRREILVIASDLQSARNVSTVRPEAQRLRFQRSIRGQDNVDSLDELAGVKTAPLHIERVEPVEPGMSAD
jgi:hypothetical protein